MKNTNTTLNVSLKSIELAGVYNTLKLANKHHGLTDITWPDTHNNTTPGDTVMFSFNDGSVEYRDVISILPPQYIAAIHKNADGKNVLCLGESRPTLEKPVTSYVGKKELKNNTVWVRDTDIDDEDGTIRFEMTKIIKI